MKKEKKLEKTQILEANNKFNPSTIKIRKRFIIKVKI
jgi:hypothetical protein